MAIREMIRDTPDCQRKKPGQTGGTVISSLNSNGLRQRMSYHLIDLVQSLGQPRLLVLGDLILDRYLWGNAERISQEAPVILVREERQEVRLGGAANVANMLRGLDVDVSMAGVVGSDPDGEELLAELKKKNVDCEAVVADFDRPTTVKERVIGHAQHRHPHQMLRIDRESRDQLRGVASSKLMDRMIHLIASHDAVLISDYAKGVCTPTILEHVISVARSEGKPVIVDPAPTADYRHYANATAITPNRTETQKATGIEIRSYSDAYKAGQKLVEELSLDRAFITLDKDGVAVVESNGDCSNYPTRQREVYDITGAGDMVLATIGVGAAAGFEAGDLAKLANVAGGLEVEQVGVACISREEMVTDLLRDGRTADDKVCPMAGLARHLDARKKMGQRVVLTNGCFDVLHIGHVTYLKQAAAEGDCLVVAINSDDSVRSLGKADDRPIFPEEQRAAMLAVLEMVDYVTVFEESTPHNLLETLKPDVLVKGGTYSVDEVVGKEIVEANGGEVKVLAEVPGVSTTRILERLRGDHVIAFPGTETRDDSTPPQRKAG